MAILEIKGIEFRENVQTKSSKYVDEQRPTRQDPLTDLKLTVPVQMSSSDNIVGWLVSQGVSTYATMLDIEDINMAGLESSASRVIPAVVFHISTQLRGLSSEIMSARSLQAFPTEAFNSPVSSPTPQPMPSLGEDWQTITNFPYDPSPAVDAYWSANERGFATAVRAHNWTFDGTTFSTANDAALTPTQHSLVILSRVKLRFVRWLWEKGYARQVSHILAEGKTIPFTLWYDGEFVQPFYPKSELSRAERQSSHWPFRDPQPDVPSWRKHPEGYPDGGALLVSDKMVAKAGRMYQLWLKGKMKCEISEGMDVLRMLEKVSVWFVDEHGCGSGGVGTEEETDRLHFSIDLGWGKPDEWLCNA